MSSPPGSRRQLPGREAGQAQSAGEVRAGTIERLSRDVLAWSVKPESPPPANLRKPPGKEKRGLGRFLACLGPGFITGAADDDPSGIATYSIAGAQAGTSLLWSALFTWPLMMAVQTVCARIGMVTGEGLAHSLRAKFPRPLLIVAIAALWIANTINVAADLSAMADAGAMLTHVPAPLLVVLFGGFITYATVRFSYARIAGILKWLALALTAYIATALIVGPDWKQVVHDTFLPSWPRGHAQWSTLVAILGTTISPYLFFWQSAQEVEEEKKLGRAVILRRQGATKKELAARRLDVGIGTFFSNLVMFFIILTTALTLHVHGIVRIETTRQVTEALRPLAGNFTVLLYTLGLLGVGFLAIPTLTGSAAYAFAETFRWSHGLDRKFVQARLFYLIIVLSGLIGIGLNFAHVSPVSALYWSAVINGLLAPFLLVGIFWVACDAKLMRGLPASKWALAGVAVAALAMFVAGVAMFLV